MKVFFFFSSEFTPEKLPGVGTPQKERIVFQASIFFKGRGVLNFRSVSFMWIEVDNDLAHQMGISWESIGDWFWSLHTERNIW